MTKVIVTNKTKWDTAMITKLFERCVEKSDNWSNRPPIKHPTIFVTVKHRNKYQTQYRGYAFLRGNEITICIPKNSYYLVVSEKSHKNRWVKYVLDPIKLARVFLHELDHVRGITHEEMFSIDEYLVPLEKVRWIKSFEPVSNYL